MHTFPTPNPITATIELVGDVRITASDRDDTTVVVNPANPSRAADVRLAEQATVEYSGGTLLVTAPSRRRQYTPWGGKGVVLVTIELPTGSHVTVDSALGHVSTDGELGECHIKTAMGNIRVDQTGALRAVTGHGNVAIDHATGDAEVKSGSGRIQIGAIDGTAQVKNSNGNTSIGDVRDELRVKAANGDVIIDRAQGSVTAKTANGSIRIAEVSQGKVEVETAAGELAVGIRKGTAAWVDASTSFGSVRNGLDMADGPTTPSGPTVEVHAHTGLGDILISRAPDTAPRSSTRSDAS